MDIPSDSSPLVSVIVPVYNVEQYLPGCLDSLANQTLKNIEIIVVNDGSPDHSQAIIDRYYQEYPQLIKPFRKENTGAADTRNFGISKAKGEFIGFVDSDDYVSPDLYEKLVKKACRTGSDVAVCHYKRVRETTGKGYVPKIIDKTAFGYPVKEKPGIILDSRPYLWNKIFKRKLFTENDFKLPPLKLCEDAAMVYPLLLAANKVEFVDEALYFYREDRQESSVNTRDSRFFDVFKAFDIILDYYKEKGALESCFNALSEQCRIILFIRLKALKQAKDKRFIRDFISAAYGYLDHNFKGWRRNPYYRRKPEYKRNYGMNRMVCNSRLLIGLYYCLPSELRDKRAGSGMKQRLISLMKKTGPGSFLYWLFSNSGRQARKFGRYYESGRLLDHYVLYSAFRGDDFNGNPYAIFRYLYHHPDMKHLVHVILIKDKKNPRVVPFLNDDRVIIISPSDHKSYAKYSETCKYLIVDTSLSPFYIKRRDQIYVYTWHSTLLKSLGAHTGLIWETHNLGKSLLDSDYFISPNRFTSERLLEAYYCDKLYKGKILELGYPRNDLLIHADKAAIRKQLNLPDDKKLVLYAPTWRGTASKPVESLDIFWEHYDRISDGLGEGYVLLIRFHHMSVKYISPEKKKLVIPFEFETNMLLAVTDILITDYSGILFDFLITKNPIILFPFDEAEYLDQRGGRMEFYLDLNDIPAPICHTPEEIADTVKSIDIIMQGLQDKYQAFFQRFAGNEDGHASERVCEVVFCGKESGDTLRNNEKQNILIIVDDLEAHRRTAHLVDFLNKANYEKYNLSILLKSIHENRTVQRKINPNAGIFYAIENPIYRNIFEWLKVKKISSKGLKKDLSKLPIKFCRRNMSRNFSGISFDTAIYYTGKSAFNSMFCLRGINAKKKVVYYTKNSDSAAFSTYQYYDEVVLYDDGIEYDAVKTVNSESFEKQFTY